MFQRCFTLVAFVVLLLGFVGGYRSLSSVGQGESAIVTTNGHSSGTLAHPLDLSTIASSDALEMAPVSVAAAAEPPTAPVIAATPAAQPEPLLAPPAQPVRVAPVARVVPPPPAAPPAAAAPPAPATCPAGHFCYPRVGIAGPIVPYGDCQGATDVGTAIRSLTCVSPGYLAAHAYTQFGRITGWRAGDVVVANGVRYVLFDAFTQRSCEYPARPLAPLSLQTSLTSTNCGMVLVVQGRPG